MNYYDNIAEGYDELHEEEQLKKLSLIVSELAPEFDTNHQSSLLDVGCGSGISTRFWKKYIYPKESANLVGIDPSEKLISKAKEKDTESTYFVGCAEKLPFQDNSFNIVISVTAIQNFEDVEKGIKEMHRVGQDSFVFSVLKRAPNMNKIKTIIKKIFKIRKEIEEDKDIIFFAARIQPKRL